MKIELLDKFEDITVREGLRGVYIIDIDGTLVEDAGLKLNPKVAAKIEELKFNSRVYLCTNSRHTERNTLLSNQLNLPLLSIRKPSLKSTVLKLKLNTNGEKIWVVGDKYLTDGLLAKNLNADFIKVRRKVSGQEPVKVKATYIIDDLAYKLFKAIW